MMEAVKPLRNHKAIGELSQAYIIAKLIEVGYDVLVRSEIIFAMTW